MFWKKKKKSTEPMPQIDTIIVIGNGFDRWQGFNTSYGDFEKYYHAHLEEILRKLHIKKHRYYYPDGSYEDWPDVELIYGDPFDPGELDSDFWNTFEDSLGNIDAERLNAFFGKEKSDLKDLKRSLRNAKRILTEAFCGWIASIAIEEADSGYQFGENCVIINFNYTDTVVKRFGVHPGKECHIHGQADDKDSIVFGHSRHSHMPEPLLKRLGGRFFGLYLIEEILYETDKHCQDNIQWLCMFLGMNGVAPEKIKDIYVLGQSMSPVDMDYFVFLNESTKVQEQEEPTEDKAAFSGQDALFQRLEYAIDQTGYGREAAPTAAEAVRQRFWEEQQARNKQFERMFLKTMGIRRKKHMDAASVPPRTFDAKWHISYYGDKDKAWKETVMKELRCTNYELHPTIDACISEFRK